MDLLSILFCVSFVYYTDCKHYDDWTNIVMVVMVSLWWYTIKFIKMFCVLYLVWNVNIPTCMLVLIPCCICVCVCVCVCVWCSCINYWGSNQKLALKLYLKYDNPRINILTHLIQEVVFYCCVLWSSWAVHPAQFRVDCFTNNCVYKLYAT